jgi:hypothetical protein
VTFCHSLELKYKIICNFMNDTMFLIVTAATPWLILFYQGVKERDTSKIVLSVLILFFIVLIILTKILCWFYIPCS